MNFVSIGDLSRVMMLRQSNANLKESVSRLSYEMTTGKAHNISSHLNGDLHELGRVEHGLAMAKSYGRVSAEAASTATGMQLSLERLQLIAEDTGTKMAADTTLSVSHGVQTVAEEAKGQLNSAISALNSAIGGRFLFSGAKVDVAPLVSADDLVAQASAVISGSPSADIAMSRLNAWFDAPGGGGGYADTAYLGSDEQAPVFLVDESTTVSLSHTALDRGVKGILKGLVVGALIADGAFASSESEQAAFLKSGGSEMMEGNRHTTAACADIGLSQQTVEKSKARTEALSTSLQIERNALIGIDGYEAGSKLVEAEAKLNALYAMTARLSNLSLANYL